jgi:hypothetical protein
MHKGKCEEEKEGRLEELTSVCYLIYKNKRGVYLSVCVDKNWAVPERFFQSLPVPCGVFWGVGEGRAR